jgi:hypothetical protein
MGTYSLNLGTVWNLVLSFIHRPPVSGERAPGSRVSGSADPIASLHARKKRYILSSVGNQTVVPSFSSL